MKEVSGKDFYDFIVSTKLHLGACTCLGYFAMGFCEIWKNSDKDILATKKHGKYFIKEIQDERN
jgi:hypothetical protein